ncbi:hypothetical protein B0H19DRAFT_1072243 [Mycena capillaripes]|nr:hypothetical protein B0H19DRAFT_1072243 [Mycena capillaripes]
MCLGSTELLNWSQTADSLRSKDLDIDRHVGLCLPMPHRLNLVYIGLPGFTWVYVARYGSVFNLLGLGVIGVVWNWGLAAVSISNYGNCWERLINWRLSSKRRRNIYKVAQRWAVSESRALTSPAGSPSQTGLWDLLCRRARNMLAVYFELYYLKQDKWQGKKKES